MSYVLDGKEVKIGDKLYDLVFGNGVVDAVASRWVAIKFGYYRKTFDSVGCHANVKCNRTLYWSKPIFDIPKPPKTLVKKYRIVYDDGSSLKVSSRHFISLDEFKKFNIGYKPIELIQATMIEVEE